MWKENTVQVIPIVISSTGVIPKSPSQSLKRQLASKYIHTNAKTCNSWHMFNCKKLSKLEIRPPRLLLLTIKSQER